MRLWLVVAALLLFVALTRAQGPEGYTLAVGRIGGTDLELEACYFQVGQAAMLALHPNGEPCQIARQIVGRTGRLVFIPDAR